jgi:NAD(P)-dependent dehydrogenase (short-subunit alcohol dehydrogenase family)
MTRVVLVTGCSSGIGRAIANEAARSGHVVYAGVRDPASGERLASMPGVVPVTLDVTSEADREAAVERVRREHGRLDVLVNNAGVALGGFLEQLDEDEIRHLFDVNVFGAWALTRAALPHLRESRGLVVLMSSKGWGRRGATSSPPSECGSSSWSRAPTGPRSSAATGASGVA